MCSSDLNHRRPKHLNREQIWTTADFLVSQQLVRRICASSRDLGERAPSYQGLSPHKCPHKTDRICRYSPGRLEMAEVGRICDVVADRYEEAHFSAFPALC